MLAITYLWLKELIPYARNSKRHPATQVAKLKASLVEFGWTRPIAIADQVIIFGHGIFEAAQQLAEADIKIPNLDSNQMAPTVDLSHLTEAQRRAYVIADNRLSEDGSWDRELLTIELTDLQSMEFDLSMTGFGAAEIDGMISPGVDPAGEWQGMPAFEQEDKSAFQSIIIHFKDQDAVNQFATLIGQTFTSKTKFTWFPQVARERSADKPVYGSAA